ncbi:MAG: tetratricopeptide repeat protein [Victivallales bacterium]|jgi:hypothetical protein
MSTDKDTPKDSAFSFEKTPNKIGGEAGAGKTGQENDFNFSDIPVLGGKGDKEKKVSFSFDSKKNIKPQQKEQGLSSFEAILRDQINQPQEKKKAYDVPDTESYKQEEDASQSKWDKIASGNKSDSKPAIPVKVMIIFAVATAVVVAAGVFSFFFLKSKPEPQGAQPAVTSRPAKPDPKAEEAARRLAGLEKRLADADAARKESKFSDALKAYQGLMDEGWKEKEPAILFRSAECLENMSQEDEAVSSYVKCIDAGWKDDAQPYVKAANLLNKKANYTDSIKYLEKAKEAFPADNTIGAQLSYSYCLAGQTDKGIAELKKANKSALSLDMTMLFGTALQKNNEKDLAKEVYSYGMKKFRDLDCFMAAAALSDKPQDKIEIMTQAVDAADDSRKSMAVMRLTELLVQTGRKDEAAKQLEKITFEQLKPEYATDFLKMLVNSANLPKFTTEYKKAVELHPKNFAMHRTVYETLLENGLETFAFDTYRGWWESKKKDAVAGYIYAKFLGTYASRLPDLPTEDTFPIYKKVVELDPQFFEAFLELGYLYTMERDWAGAENAYSTCVKMRPDDKNSRYLLSLAKERGGKGEEAFDEYEKYLGTLNLPPEDKASELIELALRLDKPDRAEKQLGVIGKNPKYESEHRVQTMKLKLIYGKPDDKDFADPYPKEGRIFHEYYLLSKGRNNEVLLMTVPPAEFPDFWKLFILWRTDRPGWQEGIEALIAKNKSTKDMTYRMIADIWNGKRTPDDARKLINKVHPDNEPLFFLMLAEKYRKDKIESKAKVCYQKAAIERRNPLVSVIDYYSQMPIK